MLRFEVSLTLKILEQRTIGGRTQGRSTGRQVSGRKLHALTGPLPHALHLNLPHLRMLHRHRVEEAAQRRTGNQHRTTASNTATNHALSVLSFQVFVRLERAHTAGHHHAVSFTQLVGHSGHDNVRPRILKKLHQRTTSSGFPQNGNHGTSGLSGLYRFSFDGCGCSGCGFSGNRHRCAPIS